MCVGVYIYTRTYLQVHTHTRVYTSMCIYPTHSVTGGVQGVMVTIIEYCNIMAEGFRFMLLGLVRLRTFRLCAWVSLVQHECRCSHARAGWTYHSEMSK